MPASGSQRMLEGMIRASIRPLFLEYAAAHRHPLNRLSHKIAIPLIMFHAVAMADWLRIPGGSSHVSFAHFGIALAGAWYLWASPKLGAIILAWLIGCLAVGARTPPWAVLSIAVIGWTTQLAGHAVFEKNSPAFVKNLIQTLIGPLFFLAELTGDIPDTHA